MPESSSQRWRDLWSTNMYVWMDGCMDACMSVCVCMYVCLAAWLSGCLAVCQSACMHACMCACVHVCIYVWMDGWVDVCMHGLMDGCMDVSCHVTCIYTYTYPIFHRDNMVPCPMSRGWWIFRHHLPPSLRTPDSVQNGKGPKYHQLFRDSPTKADSSTNKSTK